MEYPPAFCTGLFKTFNILLVFCLWFNLFLIYTPTILFYDTRKAFVILSFTNGKILMDNRSLKQIYTDRIQQTVNYISEHLAEKITLDTLASVACFSSYHFHRIFTAFTGETPRDYIERIRMESAANRLCDMPNKSVTEIAGEVGFESIAPFSRLFKKYYHLSPTELRKKHRSDLYFMRQSKRERLKPLTEEDFSSIEIRMLSSLHVAYTQTMQGYATGIAQTWLKLKSFATVHQLIQKDTLYMGIPFDNPGITPAEKCRYRACITVPENIFYPHGEIKFTDMAGGKYAFFHFKGTSDNLFRAFDFIYGEWLPANGYIPEEKPQIEFYGSDFLSDFNTKNYRKYNNIQIAMPVSAL